MNDQTSTGRHPVDIGHLVMGVALLGLLGVWALWQADVVDGVGVGRLMALPWVLAGAVGLVTSAVTRRHALRQSEQQTAQTYETYETEEMQ